MPGLFLVCDPRRSVAQSLEGIGRRSTKPPCKTASKIMIERATDHPYDLPRILEIDRAAGMAFHGNEIFRTDKSQTSSMKVQVLGTGKGEGIHAPDSAQQFDAIVCSIGHHQHCGDRIIRVTASQFGLITAGS